MLQDVLQKGINVVYHRYDVLSDSIENGHTYDRQRLKWIELKAKELMETCNDIINICESEGK